MTTEALRPLIIGIAGGSASGKTTVAQELAKQLGDRCLTVSHDRYYRPLPEGTMATHHNFDHPDALDNARLAFDLGQLQAGRSVRLPGYDMAQHTRLPESAWDTAAPREIVLVEGILILAVPALRTVLDGGVFVDTPADIRLIRRVRRDVVDRGRQVLDILTQYERTVRPMHEQFVAPSQAHADLTLDGTHPIEALMSVLLPWALHVRPQRGAAR